MTTISTASTIITWNNSVSLAYFLLENFYENLVWVFTNGVVHDIIEKTKKEDTKMGTRYSGNSNNDNGILIPKKMIIIIIVLMLCIGIGLTIFIIKAIFPGNNDREISRDDLENFADEGHILPDIFEAEDENPQSEYVSEIIPEEGESIPEAEEFKDDTVDTVPIIPTDDADVDDNEEEISVIPTPSTDSEESLYDFAQTMYIANVRHSVHFRKNPGEDGDYHCDILLGEMVTYLGNYDGTYAEIIYNGVKGYVKSIHLSANDPLGHGVPSSGIDTEKTMYIANVNHSVHLRKNPSEDGDYYCDILLGEKVTFLHNYDDTYALIRYNGNTGYVKIKHLSY